MTTLFLCTWGVALLLPLLLLRGRRILVAYAVEALAAIAAFIAWKQLPDLDLYFAGAAFSVCRLALFSAVVATSRDEEVRWTANRAALAALLIYAVTVPAMLRTPIDGDEPFYLLVTESIVHDGDLDLRNQYLDLARSEAGRTDLEPQAGDPTGDRGEIYSRHPPFLPFVLIPGYAAGGLHGALAVLAIFGALLVRGTLRLLEDEQIPPDVQRMVFPFVAFAPPVLFYATRIWPEVPGAYFFVEALRGLRDRRIQRWLPFAAGLVLLKLRFVLVAVPIAVLAFVRDRRRTMRGGSLQPWLIAAVVAASLLAVPMLVSWFVHGNPLNVHTSRELFPWAPRLYVVGAFGILVDGAAGMLFQAPFFMLGIFAIARWRTMPESFRLGCMTALLYMFYLVPRSEWHGGWSPPLRYIVIFIPVLALGAAVMLRHRPARAVLPVIGLWTTMITAHGVAQPWRLFQIANGENWIGEALSRQLQSDASRIFPSFIRINDAAVIASLLLIAVMLLVRFVRLGVRVEVVAALASIAIAVAVHQAKRPGNVVHFEDAHVTKSGGELFPEMYTVARFRFRGGWILRPGDSVSFLARRGRSVLEYVSEVPATVEIAGRAVQLEPTGGAYHSVVIEIPQSGRTEIRGLSGVVNLDRMTHD